MDLATVGGLILGFMTIGLSIFATGSGGAFIHIPSMAIVVGGMLCSTLTHFSMAQFLSIFTIVKKTFTSKLLTPSELIQQIVNYAAINRRDGALALEEQLRKIDDKFVQKGLQMLVDGQDEESVRDLMDLEIQHLQDRHNLGKMILDYMGACAPAMGMIGTLIGLVAMLRNLSDPGSLGAGMAVALITTFYGAFLSNLLFIPLAGKLGIYSK
jgi:chemotaxis protein MotA